MSSGEHRRSARIQELETKKIETKGKGTCYTEEDEYEDEDTGNDESYLKPRRKKVKSRTVQDLIASSVENQLKTKHKLQVGNSRNQEHYTNSAAVSSGTPLPRRSKLYLLLDTLKKGDWQMLLAEPVIPEEVKKYYDLVQEIMDFRKIKARLNGGSYKTLEEFECDVLLLWNSRMLYNRTTPVHSIQALRGLPKQLFDALKNDPNFESRFCMERSGKRSKTAVNIQNSSGMSTDGNQGIALTGSRGERRSEYSVVGPRETRRPLNTVHTENESIFSAVSHSSKQPIQDGAGDFNPYFPTSNYQRQALGLNVTSCGKGKNPLIGELPSSYFRRQFERIFGPSQPAVGLPQFYSGSDWNLAMNYTQFQPMTGGGSTLYGNFCEQPSQGWPTGFGQHQPFYNKSFQQPENNSMSGNNLRAVQLSDIDEWFGTGPNRGGASGAPPANSQDSTKQTTRAAGNTGEEADPNTGPTTGAPANTQEEAGPPPGANPWDEADPNTGVYPWTLRL